MPKTAYLFPGQGSQSVGMLADVAPVFPEIEQTFAQASQVLGYDLWALVQEDGNRLGQTQITQPALLAASVALWRVLQAQGAKQPDYLAGHSLGEYSALVCAGAFSFEDGIKLVEYRGQEMQKAVPEGTGAMYAIIGLADNKIQTICQQVEAETEQVVSPVNYNSPGQVVIAGSAEAASKAGELCKEAGAKRALPLAVSVPSHCALMQPAAQKLAQMLDSIQVSAPKIAVVNNVDVSIETDPDAIKRALVRQLSNPVRWTESVELLAQNGVTRTFEVGPGKVLSGLVKRIDKSVSCEPLNTLATLQINH